jgi:hypothetical protein
MKALVVVTVLLAASLAAAQDKPISEMERCRAYSVNIKQDRDSKEALLAEALATIAALKAEVAKLLKEKEAPK